MPSVPSPTAHPVRTATTTSSRPTPLLALDSGLWIRVDPAAAIRSQLVMREVDAVGEQGAVVEQAESIQPFDRPRAVERVGDADVEQVLGDVDVAADPGRAAAPWPRGSRRTP